MLSPRNPAERLKARGADTRPAPRFDRLRAEPEADGWDLPDEEHLLRTEIVTEQPRSIITRNSSPDIPFDRSINPYRGCEHGCIYCYARPSHAYLGLSPGLDFETKITAKPEAARLLAAGIRAAAVNIRCDATSAADAGAPAGEVDRLAAMLAAALDDAATLDVVAERVTATL